VLSVLPDLRGRGIGTMLMDAVDVARVERLVGAA
jgi:ribosomal protein S18 acetylase RimI-like enzyme